MQQPDCNNVSKRRGTDIHAFHARMNDYVCRRIQVVYDRYGFEPLHSPIIEAFDDMDDSVYPSIHIPYKCYHFDGYDLDEMDANAYTSDFVQSDARILGANSRIADAEMVMIAHDCLDEIGFTDFTISLNHSKIIEDIGKKSGVTSNSSFSKIQHIVDCVSDLIQTNTREKLEKSKISECVIQTVCNLLEQSIDDPFEVLDNIREYIGDSEGIDELEEILSFLPSNIIKKVKFDFALASGSKYYSGLMLKATIKHTKKGTILKGGQFNNADGYNIPDDQAIYSVGMSIFLDRIIDAIKELRLDSTLPIASHKIFILDNPKYQYELVALASLLRTEFDVSILYGIKNYEKAYQYAKHYDYGAIIELVDDNKLIVALSDNMQEHSRLTNFLDKSRYSEYVMV